MSLIIKLIPLEIKRDDRGYLSEVSPILKERARHLFVASVLPGKSRGNHYHKRKTEWVLVIKGQLKLILEEVETREKTEVVLSEKRLQLLEIPVNVQVSLVNLTKTEAIFLAIFDETFDPSDPDVWVYGANK